jgi:hypothetical protein
LKPINRKAEFCPCCRDVERNRQAQSGCVPPRFGEQPASVFSGYRQTPERINYYRTILFNLVHYIPIYIQHDATLHCFFIYENCFACFVWYLHPSSGAHATVSTASGICHTVTAICHYHGRVGTAEQFQLFHDSGR